MNFFLRIQTRLIIVPLIEFSPTVLTSQLPAQGPDGLPIAPAAASRSLLLLGFGFRGRFRLVPGLGTRLSVRGGRSPREFGFRDGFRAIPGLGTRLSALPRCGLRLRHIMVIAGSHDRMLAPVLSIGRIGSRSADAGEACSAC
jgi:hypothetical protein